MDDAKARDEITATVRSVLNRISGVYVEKVEAERDARAPWRITVHAIAWGPGLHGMTVVWTGEIARHIPSGIPGVRSIRRKSLYRKATAAFSAQIALQGSRATRALSLGIFEPLALPSAAIAASKVGAIRTDHLVVDRSHLLSLVASISSARDAAGADRASLDQQLAFDTASAYETDLQAPTVHAGESVHDDGRIVRGVNVIRSLPVMLHEVRTPSGTESVLQAHFAFGGKVKATFDGSHLILLAPVPDTVLAACAGRTVGEIIETGTDADGREIVSAESVGAATVFAVRFDPVRLSDLPDGIVTREAVEAMQQVPLR